MNKRIYYIVNGITIYRIVAAPLLILLIIYKQMDWFKWLLALSFCTDAIDGFLARKYKVSSIAGARLDSIGDDLTVLAGVIGMIVFKSALLKQEIFIVISLSALFVLHTVLALIKYRKLTSFHTYAAKTAAVLQATFLILLFWLPNPVFWLFYAAIILTAFALIEEIIIIFLLSDWKADIKGLYWIITERKRKHE